MAVVYFRFVEDENVDAADFLPQGKHGKRLQPRRPIRDPDAMRAWDEGVSVYDEFKHACLLAEGLDFRPGMYIARLDVAKIQDLEVVQTGRDIHHYTIFARPETILALLSGPVIRIPGAPTRRGD